MHGEISKQATGNYSQKAQKRVILNSNRFNKENGRLSEIICKRKERLHER